MHIGHRNPKSSYTLNGVVLSETEAEKDLGVLISNDLKPSKHINAIAAKANKIVGLIKRTFAYIDVDMGRSLYVSLVRPHLEYAVQSWSPYFKKDIEELEKVQRRMTKLVTGISELQYEERCKRLNITTLETRRLRGDLIQTYKIVNDHDNVNKDLFFEKHVGITRGNSAKLVKRGNWRTQVRANAFSIRVVNHWNNLPEEVVQAPSISSFKSRLDKFWSNRVSN